MIQVLNIDPNNPEEDRILLAADALRQGYAYRRLFYWLNTALIHVGLFGDAHYCRFNSR
jgi:hypothetical protein